MGLLLKFSMDGIFRSFPNHSTILSLIFINLFSVPVYSQLKKFNYTPTQYTVASQELGEWYALATKQEPALSATEFGQLTKTSSHWDPNPKWVRWAFEFGVSRSLVALDDKTRSAFSIFGTDPSDLPNNMYFTRFHFTKALSQKALVSLTYLFNPDLDIYGFGATYAYTFLKLGSLHTSADVFYSYAWKTDFMKATVFGGDLTQSLNLGRFDLFGGVRFIHTNTAFDPIPDQFSFVDIKYVSPSGQDKFYGFGWAPLPHIRITAEVIYDRGRDPSYLGKLSIKFPSNRVKAPFVDRSVY